MEKYLSDLFYLWWGHINNMIVYVDNKVDPA